MAGEPGLHVKVGTRTGCGSLGVAKSPKSTIVGRYRSEDGRLKANRRRHEAALVLSGYIEKLPELFKPYVGVP